VQLTDNIIIIIIGVVFESRDDVFKESKPAVHTP